MKRYTGHDIEDEAFGDVSIKTWIFSHATFSFCAGRGGVKKIGAERNNSYKEIANGKG